MTEQCHIYTAGTKCENTATHQVSCGNTRYGPPAYKTQVCTKHMNLYESELYRIEFLGVKDGTYIST